MMSRYDLGGRGVSFVVVVVFVVVVGFVVWVVDVTLEDWCASLNFNFLFNFLSTNTSSIDICWNDNFVNHFFNITGFKSFIYIM